MRLSASLHRYQVVAGILPAVEGGILPPGPGSKVLDLMVMGAAIPPGETPGSEVWTASAELGGGGQPGGLALEFGHSGGPDTWAKGLRFYQAAAAWTMVWQVAGALPVAKVIGLSASCLRNSVTKSRHEGRLAPRRHLGKGA